MRTSCVKNGLVFGIITLLICMSITPSVAVDTVKKPPIATVENNDIENEYVEFIIETSGFFKNTQHRISLPKKQADEIENYLNNINYQLNKVKSREETRDLLNNVIIKLDEYGLLNDLSVNQVQKIVFNNILNLKLSNIVGNINSDENDGNDVRNNFCLVYTKVDGMTVCVTLRFIIFSYWLWIFLANTLGLNYWDAINISSIFDIGYLIFPFRLFGTAIVFPNLADIVEYFSIGLRGIKKGGEWSIMVGFTGLNILKYNDGLT